MHYNQKLATFLQALYAACQWVEAVDAGHEAGEVEACEGLANCCAKIAARTCCGTRR